MFLDFTVFKTHFIVRINIFVIKLPAEVVDYCAEIKSETAACTFIVTCGIYKWCRVCRFVVSINTLYLRQIKYTNNYFYSPNNTKFSTIKSYAHYVLAKTCFGQSI